MVTQSGIEIGVRIKALMKEQGFTQKSLADASGVSQTMISRMFSKDAPKKSGRLMDIARVLGVSFDQLVGDIPAPKFGKNKGKRHELVEVTSGLGGDSLVILLKIANNLSAAERMQRDAA